MGVDGSLTELLEIAHRRPAERNLLFFHSCENTLRFPESDLALLLWQVASSFWAQHGYRRPVSAPGCPGPAGSLRRLSLPRRSFQACHREDDASVLLFSRGPWAQKGDPRAACPQSQCCRLQGPPLKAGGPEVRRSPLLWPQISARQYFPLSL